MAERDHSGNSNNGDTYVYGLGNPNVQSQTTTWDVYLAPLALVVLGIGFLLFQFDLSLAGFADWFVGLGGGE